MHMKEQCGKQPKWQCSYCGHKTYRKYNLKLHVLHVHRNDVPRGV
nr:unnamed protein product [Callosobruchus analis]